MELSAIGAHHSVHECPLTDGGVAVARGAVPASIVVLSAIAGTAGTASTIHSAGTVSAIRRAAAERVSLGAVHGRGAERAPRRREHSDRPTVAFTRRCGYSRVGRAAASFLASRWGGACGRDAVAFGPSPRG